MLDQNTTTVLSTLITVLGTLGGVVLGVILSNRYVATQERAKRNTTVIEETYTLINDIDNQMRENIHSNYLKILTEIGNNIQRSSTLIYLYLPPIRDNFDDYAKQLYELMDRMRSLGGPVDVTDPKYAAIYDTDFYLKYKQSQGKLMHSLEKLVK